MTASATIDYGDAARLGVILPSGNIVAEAELRAMLPAGIGLHVTRLALTSSSAAALQAMAAGVDQAARLLADARVDRIVFHCTAVTTFAPESGAALRRRIEAATGIRALATSDALLAGLAALSARRIVLLTPYIAEVHARERDFLETHGLEIVGGEALGIDGNAEMARLPPATLVELGLRNKVDDADAYLLSCTALRSAGVIAPLEAALGRPVLTSNQAIVWHALRDLGMAGGPAGFGRLFLM
jgi:maleate isomerase